jgi:glycosyltransferase involved in cell wall biosynthesis
MARGFHIYRKSRIIKRAPKGPYRTPKPKRGAPGPAPAAPAVSPLYRAHDDRPAVVFECPWNRVNVGWDILARRYARAMVAAGLDARLYPPAAGLSPEVAKEAAAYAMRVDSAEINVWSTCFHRPDVLVPELARYLLPRPSPRVFYTMFERVRAPVATVAWLNRHANGVWVPCSANRDALCAAGSTNARWIPVPWFDDDPFLHLPPPQRASSFYWIGAWEQRKAPDNVIRAFMRAFRPNQCTLLIKTSSFQSGFPPPEHFLAGILREPEVQQNGWRGPTGITIDRRMLTRAELLGQVHGRGDVYVSASRGEGVDMPAFEAKLAGRRVVTTDSGGPRDFLGEHDVLIKRTGEVAVPNIYHWEPGSTQGDYALADLVSALQRVHSEVPRAGVDWPREKFHYSAVGRTLKEWFEELRGVR